MVSVSAIGPSSPPQRVQPVTPQPREAPAALTPEGGTAVGVAAGVTGSARPGFGAEAGATLLEAQAGASRPAMPQPRPNAPPPAAPAQREAPPDDTTPTPRETTAAPRPSQQDQAARDIEAVQHEQKARAAEPPSRSEQERAAAATAYAARDDRAAGAPALRLTG